MREYQMQTPQKPNRHQKSISDHAKKNQKIVKKSLNAALSSVSEASFDPKKDLPGFTLLPDNPEHDLSGILSENLTASLSDEASPGSECAASSGFTPCSSTSAIDDNELSVVPINQSIIEDSEDVSLICFEAEIAVKYLREAQRQLCNARTTDLQSKKLLDALINEIIKEFYDLSQEEESDKLTQKRAYLAFIRILLLVLATAYVVIIYFSISRHSFTGPTPT